MRKTRARLDPVSCQSCRTKKLRCNRVQPCSNCTTRGLTCTFLVLPQRRQTEPTSVLQSNTELLERIKQLESLVLQRNNAADGFPERHWESTPSANNVAAAGSSRKGERDAQSLRDVTHPGQEPDRAMQLLQNIETMEDTLPSSPSECPTFAIRSTHEILALAPDTTQESKTVIVFPVYSTAALLLENYEANVDFVCRIVHIPTVRSLMKTFYLGICQNEPVLYSQAALLLSIFGLSAFFYPPSDNSEVAASDGDVAYLSKFWSQGALDVLDHTRRNSSGTLEDIQAYILMSYATYYRDGFSARGRILSTAAISLARDLQLHRLDADNKLPAEREVNIRAFIDREVKRRVFWHIASTDWMQSTFSGPQEGMYFIHPNHIDTKLPRDCNDDDVVLGEDNEPVTKPQPTDMTFHITRIRLAHICREMTDFVPLKICELLQVPYERIIALDQKFRHFFTDTPFFFRLDPESRAKSKPLETIYPKIPPMRYCIMASAHSRRCRLHEKFLVRQSSDPRYTFSRLACLDSARTVIQLYEGCGVGAGDSQTLSAARMGTMVHFTHLAVVVLAMDLCFNKGEDGQQEIMSEIEAALRMLAIARVDSPLLGRSLDSLYEVLHKHNVRLPGVITSTTSRYFSSGLAQGAESGGSALINDTEPWSAQPQADSQSLGTLSDPSFEDFWQIATQSEMNLDSTAWDNVFSVLNSRPF